MAYQSLYRLHRPLTFDDMTGQEHITRTLSNALSSGRLAHAYLFCGPRGTGKTTTAKILARAMNCEQYPVPEPCGTCNPCQNIAAGVSIDVIEMDAASNRGIDEIRELRERTRYASAESRYKVYIIDEAHMLTTEACNAFLKTLEEPPQNVVFILATTDPSRLPSTIVSRCQRFDFHLLTVDQIKHRMEHILDHEKWKSDHEAIQLIARLADGSLRDALGILEQCSAYGEEQISAEHVRSVTGATRTETIDALIKAAVDNDPKSGLEIIEQVVYSGRDLQLLMRDLTFVFSRLLLYSETKGQSGKQKLHGFETIVDSYHGQISRHLLLDAVELLHEVSGELRHAHFPQFILEVALIRLLRLLHGRVQPAPVLKPDEEKRAEEKVPQKKEPVHTKQDEKVSAHKSEDPKSAVRDAGQVDEQETTQGSGKEGSGKEPISLADLKDFWPRILQELKKKQKSTAAWLEPAELEDFRGELVCLTYSTDYSIHQMRISEDNHRKLVEEVLSNYCLMPVRVKAIIKEEMSEEENANANANANSEVYLPSENKPESVQAGPAYPDQVKVDQSQTEASYSSGEQHGQGEKSKKAPSAEDAMEIFGGKLIEPD